MIKIRKYCMFHYSKDSSIFIKIFSTMNMGTGFASQRGDHSREINTGSPIAAGFLCILFNRL